MENSPTLTNRIPVVSVIEISGHLPEDIVVHAYPDTAEGSRAAEAHFIAIAKEQKVGEDDRGRALCRFSDEAIEDAIHAGILDDGLGWTLYLTHSEAGDADAKRKAFESQKQL